MLYFLAYEIVQAKLSVCVSKNKIRFKYPILKDCSSGV